MPPGQHCVESPDPRLAAPDHRASLACQLRVETRADDYRCRQRHSALVVGPVAGVGNGHAGVAALQRRYAEAQDSGRIARADCGPFRDALVAHDADQGNGAEDADNHQESLVVGHLLLDLTRPHIGGRRILCRRGSGILCYDSLLLLLLL
jgi:hypothetical protein